MPLPEAFGQVFGFWLKDQPRGEYVFAKAAGQKPVSAQAARAYLRGMLQQAGIEKKISPHKLRHTYATVTVHSPRPLAGEGLGVRAAISKTYPLTLTLPHEWGRGD